MRVRASLAGILPAILLAAAGCIVPNVGPLGARPLETYGSQVIRGAPWTDLVVQIDYAPGRVPSEAATTHLLDTLHNVTRKSTIELDLHESPELADPGHAWNVSQLVPLEKQLRRFDHVAPRALVHVLYPAGTYEAPGVSGVTYAGCCLGPVTVFLDTMRSTYCATPGAGPIPGILLPAAPQAPAATDLLERSTLLHEVGHAIGLVNNGLPMQRNHEDAAHPGHSIDNKSVMYWAFDNCRALQQVLLQDGTLPDRFDGDDASDIRAGGGK